MRSKMEYVMDKDEKGKTTIRKVGLQPIQREGLDYEFTICGDVNQEHNYVISKSRCPEFADAVIEKPGKQFAEKLLAWLNEGAKEEPKAESVESAATTLVKEIEDATSALKPAEEPTTLTKLVNALEGMTGDANDWLLDKGWIKEKQTFRDLPEKNMTDIIERLHNFKRAVKSWKVQQEQQVKK